MQRILMGLIGIIVVGYMLSTPETHSGAAIAPPTTTTTATASATLIATSVAVPVPDVADELFEQINRLRTSLGLTPYIFNSMLSTAALDQAHWMASVGVVTHIRPDGNRPSHRALAAGYPESQSCSEIIYMSRIATMDDALKWWMNSKIHYGELTNPRHRDAGAGVARSPEFGLSLVVVFCGYIVPPPVVAPSALPTTYVVQPGDTLYRLSLRYGVPVPTLAAANNMNVNDIIYVGQVLVIPQPATPTPAPTLPPTTPTLVPTATLTPTLTPTNPPRFHVVQRGETLFQISRIYGVPVDKLIATNGLINPDRLQVGQVIIIP
jgi:LysM repeat protein/uncharacterized protein YkwD